MAKQHYSTMSTEDICDLPIRKITTNDALCFMWATFPNIGEALKVMSAWGFEYKTAAFVCGDGWTVEVIVHIFNYLKLV